MKLSEQSLRNWIKTELPIELMCEQLTISGLEVEDIKVYMKNFENVIIGKIVSIKRNTDTSPVCIIQLNIGIKLISIMCNYNNIKNNTKVCFLYKNKKLFNDCIIESCKMYGQVYSGKICSLKDLDISSNEDKILKLPYSAPVGLYIKDYNFYKDKIIKINTAFNRVDIFGAFGVARELCILNNLSFPKIMHIKTPILIEEICKIDVKDNNMIYSCLGRIIKNINLKKKTPIWIQDKLRKSGIDSVNIVVDIINFVFIELGQSIYVFSFSRKNFDIIVDWNNQDIFFSKNGNIVLENNFLILKHKNSILSCLGNIDFNLFPVDLQDNNIFIGSFFFDPQVLNSSIYHMKLHYKTELHEYFVDPGSQEDVIEYTTNLFLKICGGFSGAITSIKSKSYKKYVFRKIKLSYKYLIKFIGCNIQYNVIENILVQLGYTVIVKNNYWYVIPPSWRLDVLIVEDVISDILRIYQYNNIELKPLINNNTTINHSNISENTLKRVKYTLIDLGYYEVINYSFIDPKIQNYFYPNKKFLSLLNPISKDMSCMRCSIWPGLIKTLIYHQNRQYDTVRFFESGLCFIPISDNTLGVKQNIYFSGIIGNIGLKKNHWDIPAKQFDFYDLKGDVECIFDSIGYLQDIIFKKKKIPGLHTISSTEIILNNQVIGRMGQIDPVFLKTFNIHYSTFLFELFWYKLHLKHTSHIRKISDFPHSIRDIAIVLDENILVGDLVLLCKQQFLSEIYSIQVLDVYRGSSIACGKKSVTLAFCFQSIHTTLTDKRIDHIMNQCIKYLCVKFHAVLRY